MFLTLNRFIKLTNKSGKPAIDILPWGQKGNEQNDIAMRILKTFGSFFDFWKVSISKIIPINPITLIINSLTTKPQKYPSK